MSGGLGPVKTGFGRCTTDDIRNRYSSAYMSLCASNQSNFHFCGNKMLLFISDELFLCLTFPKYNLSISVVQFLKSLDSTIFVYKCLVTRN